MSNKRKVFSIRFFAYSVLAIILLAGAITFGILGSALIIVVALSLGVIVAGGMAVFEYISSKNSPDLRLQNKLHELFEIHPNKNQGGQFFVPDTYTTENINQLFTEINQLIPEVDDESLDEFIQNYFEILIYLRNSIRNKSLNPSSQEHQLFFLTQLNKTFATCVERRLKTNTSLEKILRFANSWLAQESHTNLFDPPFFVVYQPETKLLQLAPIELIATTLTNMILREVAINSDSTQIESHLNSAINLFTSFNKKSLEDYTSVLLSDKSSANAVVPETIKTQFTSAQKVVGEQLNNLRERQIVLAEKRLAEQSNKFIEQSKKFDELVEQSNKVIERLQRTAATPSYSPAVPPQQHTDQNQLVSAGKQTISGQLDVQKQFQESLPMEFSPPLFTTQKATTPHTDELWQKMRNYLERTWGLTDRYYQDTADGLFVGCGDGEHGANWWCDQINNQLGIGKMVEPATLDGRLGFLFKAENFQAILAAKAKADKSSKSSGCQFM